MAMSAPPQLLVDEYRSFAAGGCLFTQPSLVRRSSPRAPRAAAALAAPAPLIRAKNVACVGEARLASSASGGAAGAVSAAHDGCAVEAAETPSGPLFALFYAVVMSVALALSGFVPLLRASLGAARRVQGAARSLLWLVLAFAALDTAACVATRSAHILMVSVAFRGHVVPLARLATELVARGHRVTFAVHDDGREFIASTGAKFLSLGRHPLPAEERRAKLRQVSHEASHFRSLIALANDVYLPYAAPVYEALLPAVSRDPPDLMIVDAATFGAIDAALAYNVPLVLNVPSSMFTVVSAGPHTPAPGSGLSERMTWWERCLSLFFPRQLLAVALTPMLMELSAARQARGLPPLESFDDIAPGSFVLVNSVVGLEPAEPLPPLVQLTGPMLPPHHALLAESQLPASLRELADVGDVVPERKRVGLPLLTDEEEEARFIAQVGAAADGEAAGRGVVLLLFGSGSQSYLENTQVAELRKALSDSRMRVVWALRAELKSALAPMSSSSRVRSNFPQLPLLAHPAVRLVVSPCGAATTQEALYFGKPLLCIPLLGDQVDMAARVRDRGAGLVLDKSTFDAAQVREALSALLGNASFRNAARRVGNILRANGGCHAAADRVESLLAAGTSHLVPAHASWPWHRAKHLDLAVLAVAAALPVVLLAYAGLTLAAFAFQSSCRAAVRICFRARDLALRDDALDFDVADGGDAVLTEQLGDFAGEAESDDGWEAGEEDGGPGAPIAEEGDENKAAEANDADVDADAEVDGADMHADGHAPRDAEKKSG